MAWSNPGRSACVLIQELKLFKAVGAGIRLDSIIMLSVHVASLDVYK